MDFWHEEEEFLCPMADNVFFPMCELLNNPAVAPTATNKRPSGEGG
jgi:hypothetical protein